MEKPVAKGETLGQADQRGELRAPFAGMVPFFSSCPRGNSRSMTDRVKPTFQVLATMRVAALIAVLGAGSAQASQSGDIPLLPPVSGPQDALTAGEIASDLPADPIHPWDNNGYSDSTQASGPGRARQRLKTPVHHEEKSVIEPPLRKATTVTRPEKIEFVRNLPNPFNAQTKIEFSLSQSGKVTLEIYNLLGQTQNRLEWPHLDAGVHSWVWQGVSSDGRSLPSGVYFYRIEVDQISAVGKMVLLK